MARKPRSDSVLDGLPPERREQLVRWLVDENLKYPEAVQRVWEKFGVKTSVNALQRFYARKCFALRADQAREFADLVVEQAGQDPEKFDQATMALIRQKAFERVYARDGSPADLALVAGILGDSAKLELKRQELALSFERLKLQQLDAAKAALAHVKELREIASDSTTSDAEKLERARLRLFGDGAAVPSLASLDARKATP